MIWVRKQSSASYPIPFLLVLSSDGKTGATGKTPTLTLRRPGGSFAAADGVVTEIAHGWYEWNARDDDLDTIGANLVHVTAADCDPVDFVMLVSPHDPFDTIASNVTRINGSQEVVGWCADLFTGGSPLLSIGSMSISNMSVSDFVSVNGVNLMDDRLDVAVSTRLAAADYTAPDNAAVAAIKAKTDLLTIAGGKVAAQVLLAGDFFQSFPANFASLAIDGDGRVTPIAAGGPSEVQIKTQEVQLR